MTSGPAKARVIRDHAWVEREYNREKYPKLLQAAMDVTASGNRHCPSVFAHVFRTEQGAVDLLQQRPFVAGGLVRGLPVPFGQWGILGSVNHLLGALFSENTGSVIELGAGWGRNLFLAYLTGMISPRAKFYALEYAEAGRQTADIIAKLDPSLDLQPLAFDYHAPDYQAIEPSLKPALVATIHSVEQIPFLRREVFTKLIDRLPNLTGLHLEPVGWQLPGAEKSADTLSHSDYAERHDYNRNLWQVLKSLEDDGVIEIGTVSRDYMGMNVDNPSSMIIWRARAAG